MYYQPDAQPASRLLLCVPDNDRELGCLIAPNAGNIAAAGDWLTGSAVSTRLERGGASDPIRFLHPLNPNWRLGLLEAGGTTACGVGFSHQDPGLSCNFYLAPEACEKIPPAVRPVAQEIASAVQLPARWVAILVNLRRGSLRPALAEALLRCLPIDELRSLSSHLTNCEADLRLLRAAMPNDPWLSHRFGALLHWNRNRDATSNHIHAVRAAQVHDLPGAKRNTAHRPRLGHTLHALTRLANQPRHMACVLGSARNEGPYLLDWIAYHRSIGFDHVFLYTNENTDGSDGLLEPLARAGAITWIRHEIGPNALPQFQAYAHALSILPQILDYRWTLVADLDEYFGYDIDRFPSVKAYLSWQETRRADAIALPWLLHLANRDDQWYDAPCTERFQQREESVNPHIKSIFRTNLYWNSSCHNPLPTLGLPFTYCAQNGRPHVARAPEHNLALAHDPQATHAWMAHYIFKSAPEAVMKILRGAGDRIFDERQTEIDHVVKPFVTLSTKRKLVADPRTLNCAKRLPDELTRLRAIPGVSASESSIKERFSREMEGACLRFLRQGPMDDESAECRIFRSILHDQRAKQLFAAE